MDAIEALTEPSMHHSSPHQPPGDDELLAQARRRAGAKLGFLIHLTVFIAVNTGLFLINQWQGGPRWYGFPLSGWGLGLAIHGLVTLLTLSGLRQSMVERELARLRRR